MDYKNIGKGVSNISTFGKVASGGVPIKSYDIPVAKDSSSEPASKGLGLINIPPNTMHNVLPIGFDNEQLIMIKKVLIALCFIPILLVLQENRNKKCTDRNKGLDQLPCTITYCYEQM